MEATAAENRPLGRAVNAVIVNGGKDRFGSAMDISGWRFECKLSGKDTGGDYCVYDTIRSVRGGPPLHIHHDQDEWFYVREGEFLFKVGDDSFRLGPGDSLFGPRKVPHAFTSLTDRSALIVTFLPAGEIEQLFFKAWRMSQSRPLTPDDWRAFGKTHGVEIVGPPIEMG